MSELTSGAKMVVHETTGTYLYPDWWSDNVGNGVQNWNQDPLHTNMLHQWYFFADGDAYRIETKNRRCLTCGAKAVDVVTFQERNPSFGARQLWYVQSMFGSDTDFAILPKAYPGYAMGLNGHGQVNDAFVVPQRMWAGMPTISQAWIIADAPEA